MQTRRFGRTNLAMPVLTCGGMRYQQSWDDLDPAAVEEAGQRNLEATVHRALELGITHIETARGYGSSEMQLGRILPRLPRDRMIVQTKVAPCASARDFRATFEKSMAYLQLAHVDLLSLHGINNAQLLEWSLRPGGCLEEARRLQREGRCRHVGFSTHATTDIILQAIASDGFDYVNLHWYFVNELNWPAVEAATARDMGVFIISPNDKGGKLYSPPPRLRELTAPFTPMQWNGLWCLSRPEVHTLSIGASRPDDFTEHVDGLNRFAGQPESLRAIEGRLRQEMVAVLGADWCARWHIGLPRYVDVPGGINVQEILRLFTYARGLGLVEWGKMRYNLLGGAGGHWFPGEKAQDFDDRAIAAACAASPFADQIPALLREAHALLNDQPKKRLSQGGT
ncbi:MAG: aldo/keto reductase [Verrucomicrobia bacterium]|nr:aldo/keto reductase [Verrucomicrobiota bacterium]